MSALVCSRCGGPVRVSNVRRSESTVEGVPAKYHRCELCGPTDAKAPEIPRHRTSMDPEIADVAPVPMPRDQHTRDLFEDAPGQPKGPADTYPTDSEGREASRR